MVMCHTDDGRLGQTGAVVCAGRQALTVFRPHEAAGPVLEAHQLSGWKCWIFSWFFFWRKMLEKEKYSGFWKSGSEWPVDDLP